MTHEPKPPEKELPKVDKMPFRVREGNRLSFLGPVKPKLDKRAMAYQLMNTADEDANNTLDKREWIGIGLEPATFEVLDKDGNGVLDMDELTAAFEAGILY